MEYFNLGAEASWTPPAEKTTLVTFIDCIL